LDRAGLRLPSFSPVLPDASGLSGTAVVASGSRRPRPCVLNLDPRGSDLFPASSSGLDGPGPVSYHNLVSLFYQYIYKYKENALLQPAVATAGSYGRTRVSSVGLVSSVGPVLCPDPVRTERRLVGFVSPGGTHMAERLRVSELAQCSSASQLFLNCPAS
jgi:hypothetical protein